MDGYACRGGTIPASGRVSGCIQGICECRGGIALCAAIGGPAQAGPCRVRDTQNLVQFHVLPTRACHLAVPVVTTPGTKSLVRGVFCTPTVLPVVAPAHQTARATSRVAQRASTSTSAGTSACACACASTSHPHRMRIPAYPPTRMRRRGFWPPARPKPMLPERLGDASASDAARADPPDEQGGRVGKGLGAIAG